MTIRICDNYNVLSEHVAREVFSQVKSKPGSVLCLAAGDTPREAYTRFVERARRESLDVSTCTFVGLDEWIGIAPENEGSCQYFLEHTLFAPLGISPSQINLFDGLTPDPEAECARIDSVIRRCGGIDLMVVGVGMNGHIGFNEPGVQDDLFSHVVNLDETTRRVGQKYFRNATRLEQGITLGFQHVLASRKLIMIASGDKKAEVMQKALQGPITAAVPATIARKHMNAIAMLDMEAAGKL